jgi:hypothetical protein
MENAVKTKRRGQTKYHCATNDGIRCLVHKQVQSGDVTITTEFQLSKEPMRVDALIIKKKPDVKIENIVCEIFRGHNIVEYKSPVDRALSLKDFYKTAFGYAGIYAAQTNVKMTDMTATIICFKRPVKLFSALKKEFGYKILRKYDGVYYIYNNDNNARNSLAVQIVVTYELPDSVMELSAIRDKYDKTLAVKVLDFYFQNEEKREVLQGHWFDVVGEKSEPFYEEDEMTGEEKFVNRVMTGKFAAKYKEQWRQEMRQEALELLKKGYSAEDVFRQLQLA